ncbi:MAG TPA: thioredoxin domain-containing protein [Verrucomicrobiae bacterium]|nr:thioredoxin domain-containing protein [Verrucomicrobiae bacterium]
MELNGQSGQGASAVVGLGVAAVVVMAFSSGWWIGHTTAFDSRPQAASDGRAQLSETSVATRVDHLEKLAAERDSKTVAALEQIQKQVEQIGKTPAPRPQQTAPAGPDTQKVYQLDLAKAPALGKADAPVTIVEFLDFQCPFCSKGYATLGELKKLYGERLRVVFKHFPLPFHTQAPLAHKAAIAAGAQGKFWQLQALLFENNANLDEPSLLRHAGSLGLDLEQLKKDMQSPETAEKLAADQREAEQLGISSVPAFFINGRYLLGAQPLDVFKSRIDEALKAAGVPIPVEDPPKLTFERDQFDMGVVKPESVTNAIFTFSNEGSGTLRILSAEGACDCTTIVVSPKELAPKALGEVAILYRASKTAGAVNQTITVSSNDPAHPKTTLTLLGKIGP